MGAKIAVALVFGEQLWRGKEKTENLCETLLNEIE